MGDGLNIASFNFPSLTNQDFFYICNIPFFFKAEECMYIFKTTSKVWILETVAEMNKDNKPRLCKAASVPSVCTSVSDIRKWKQFFFFFCHRHPERGDWVHRI